MATKRAYPKISIKDLCRKLETEQNCSYKEVHQDFGGRLRTGANLRRPPSRSFVFFPDEYDSPLSDYEIRELCRKVGLDADEVFAIDQEPPSTRRK